jgi:hypothetical protein
MRVYTTGAALIPKKMPSGNWVWIVDSFEDDTYYDGECLNVNEFADSEDGLWGSENLAEIKARLQVS